MKKLLIVSTLIFTKAFADIPSLQPIQTAVTELQVQQNKMKGFTSIMLQNLRDLQQNVKQLKVAEQFDMEQYEKVAKALANLEKNIDERIQAVRSSAIQEG